jgi:hypothetical protein
VVMWGDLAPEEIEGSLLQHHRNDPATSVCIEYPVEFPGKAQEPTRQATQEIRRMFPLADTVTPGVWKNSYRNSMLKALPPTHNGQRVSAHMRDAVGIALWQKHRVESKKP